MYAWVERELTMVILFYVSQWLIDDKLGLNEKVYNLNMLASGDSNKDDAFGTIEAS